MLTLHKEQLIDLYICHVPIAILNVLCVLMTQPPIHPVSTTAVFTLQNKRLRRRIKEAEKVEFEPRQLAPKSMLR